MNFNLFLSCTAVCGQVCMRFSTSPWGRLPAATLQAEIPQALSTVGISEITVNNSTDKIFRQFVYGTKREYHQVLCQFASKEVC